MIKIEEVYQGAYLLQGEVGGRLLQLPLLQDDGRAILLDSGCAQHVDEVILPGLRELNLQPSSIVFVINTHCDFDHVGGNYGIRKVSPQALLCCGDADREQIESPELLYRNRYDAYRAEQISYSDDVCAWIMSCLGRSQTIDITLRGGERIRLGATTELEVVFLPGHSCGHLGLLDRRRGALFGGDAIHGAVYLDLTGNPALCPTYLYPAKYRKTIDRIEGLDLDIYIGSHWSVKRGQEIHAFCNESRTFVQRAEDGILEALAEPMTLRELCHSVGPNLGSWPQEANGDLCYAFRGHLDELIADGTIHRAKGEQPSRYLRRS